jgi:hypothetical protein
MIEKIKLTEPVMDPDFQAAMKEALEHGLIEIIDYVDGQPCFRCTAKGIALAKRRGPLKRDGRIKTFRPKAE